jgi:hypothetical protein
MISYEIGKKTSFGTDRTLLWITFMFIVGALTTGTAVTIKNNDFSYEAWFLPVLVAQAWTVLNALRPFT